MIRQCRIYEEGDRVSIPPSPPLGRYLLRHFQKNHQKILICRIDVPLLLAKLRQGGAGYAPLIRYLL